MENCKWDTSLSHQDFLSLEMKKSLEGKSVDFNTAHYAFKGEVKSIIDKGNGITCIIITSPKFHRRFTKDQWKAYHSEYLNVELTKRDTIWWVNNETAVYIAFSNVNNMTIHDRR